MPEFVVKDPSGRPPAPARCAVLARLPGAGAARCTQLDQDRLKMLNLALFDYTNWALNYGTFA